MSISPQEYLALRKFFESLSVDGTLAIQQALIGQEYRHRRHSLASMADLCNRILLESSILDILPQSIPGLRVSVEVGRKYRAMASTAWRLSGYFDAQAETESEAMTDLLAITILWARQQQNPMPSLMPGVAADLATTGVPFGIATLRILFRHYVSQRAKKSYGEVYGVIMGEILNGYGAPILSALEDPDTGLLGLLFTAHRRAKVAEGRKRQMRQFFNTAASYYQGKRRYNMGNGSLVPA